MVTCGNCRGAGSASSNFRKPVAKRGPYPAGETDLIFPDATRSRCAIGPGQSFAVALRHGMRPPRPGVRQMPPNCERAPRPVKHQLDPLGIFRVGTTDPRCLAVVNEGLHLQAGPIAAGHRFDHDRHATGMDHDLTLADADQQVVRLKARAQIGLVNRREMIRQLRVADLGLDRGVEPDVGISAQLEQQRLAVRRDVARALQSAQRLVPQRQVLVDAAAILAGQEQQHRRVIVELTIGRLQHDVLVVLVVARLPPRGDRGQRQVGVHHAALTGQQVVTGHASQRIHEEQPIVHGRGPERAPFDLGAVGREPFGKQMVFELLLGRIDPGPGRGHFVHQCQRRHAERAPLDDGVVRVKRRAGDRGRGEVAFVVLAADGRDRLAHFAPLGIGKADRTPGRSPPPGP